jgi:hypothetical protein
MELNFEQKQPIQAALYPWILFSLLSDRGLSLNCSAVYSKSTGSPPVLWDVSDQKVVFLEDDSALPANAIGFAFNSLAHAISFYESGVFSPRTLRGFKPLTWMALLKSLVQIQGDLNSKGWEKKSDQQLVNKSLLLLKSAVFGLQGLARLNSFSRDLLQHVSNGSVSIRVGNSEILASVVFENGMISWVDGAVSSSEKTVDFVFRDPQCAWLSAANLADNLAAVGKGDIRLVGYIPIADGLNHLLDRLQMYVSTG